MVSAEKCLQLKVRETGQRGGRGQINSLSDASQYDKPGSWLHKSPFPEVVAIHQTLNSSIDPGWLSCAPRATHGLWEKGTTPITRLEGHGLCRATQESLLLEDLLAKAHLSFSLDVQGWEM